MARVLQLHLLIISSAIIAIETLRRYALTVELADKCDFDCIPWDHYYALDIRLCGDTICSSYMHARGDASILQYILNVEDYDELEVLYRGEIVHRNNENVCIERVQLDSDTISPYSCFSQPNDANSCNAIVIEWNRNFWSNTHHDPCIYDPTATPTSSPITVSPTSDPTYAPSSPPSSAPTSAPSITTAAPTFAPSSAPSLAPTSTPSSAPTSLPTSAPSYFPIKITTNAPIASPSTSPSGFISTSTTVPTKEKREVLWNIMTAVLVVGICVVCIGIIYKRPHGHNDKENAKEDENDDKQHVQHDDESDDKDESKSMESMYNKVVTNDVSSGYDMNPINNTNNDVAMDVTVEGNAANEAVVVEGELNVIAERGTIELQKGHDNDTNDGDIQSTNDDVIQIENTCCADV